MTFEVKSILDGWRDWDAPPGERPRIVRELGGGRSNRSYLLTARGERMVLRVNAAASTLPAIERWQEATIWRAASDAGIAPPLLHADPGGRFLVSAYIESKLPERPQDDPALQARALELLRRVHRLNVQAPTIDYTAHIEGYWRQIEVRTLPVDPSLRAQRETMRQTLGGLLEASPGLVLCHHDPVVENFVGSPGRLYLLDWEYAASGLAVMDYAALAVEWNMEAASVCRRTGILPSMLGVGQSIYRYLCALWDAAKVIE